MKSSRLQGTCELTGTTGTFRISTKGDILIDPWKRVKTQEPRMSNVYLKRSTAIVSDDLQELAAKQRVHPALGPTPE